MESKNLFLSDNQLAERFGIARGTVWRWNRENPSFPKPLKLSSGCTRWALNEITEYEKTQASLRPKTDVIRV